MEGILQSRYRPEIDGLRAIAVIAVIINHFNSSILPSGYLGVDIFFVISGYVITSSLYSRQNLELFPFLTGFYARRIKRLIPALVFFVLTTSLLLSFFNPDPAASLGIAWRALFGFSNIYLYRSSTDYFSEAIELNPFVHTWSLGVEEQFYLLFPILIWFSGFLAHSKSSSKKLLITISFLTIFSLCLFIYLYPLDQPAAYFLMPPRFWEMASGSILFLCVNRMSSLNLLINSSRISLPVFLGIFATLFAPLSLAVPATILIVLLSALLIASTSKGTLVYGLLTQGYLLHVGLISYSLYLWHWGILSISRWTIGIHWWTIPFQVLTILLVSEFSYHYVEHLFRSRLASFASTCVISFGLLSLVFSTFIIKSVFGAAYSSLYLGNSTSKSTRFSVGSREISNYVGNTTGRMASKCTLPLSEINEESVRKKIPDCLWIPPRHRGLGLPVVAFLGNSHALQLFPIAEEIAKTGEVSILNLSVGHCAIPHLPGQMHKNGGSCAPVNRLPSLVKKVIRSPMIYILASHVGPDYTPVRWDDKGYAKEFAKLSDQIGINNVLIYVAPNPKFYTLGLGGICAKEWFRPHPDCLIKENAQKQRKIRRGYIDALNLVADNHKNFFILDPFEVLCAEQDGYCLADQDGKYIYWDPSHLTVKGVLLTKHLYISILDRALRYLDAKKQY